MQFVPFNKFIGHPEDLAAAVLEELPGQVTSFYRMIGKAPNPPVTAPLPIESDSRKVVLI